MQRLDALVLPGFIPQWTLADRLRKAREAIGLSQAQLAEEVGVARRSVVNYEAGTTSPNRPIVLAWALACAVDSRWILTGEVAEGYVPGDNTSLPPARAVTGSQRITLRHAA